MEDTISRQTAIDAVGFGITYAKKINKETGEVTVLFEESNAELEKAIDRLKQLPSAQPELSAEDIQLIKKLRSYHNGSYAKVIDKLIASAQPMRKKGKWIDTGSMEEWWAEEFTCSECGWSMLGKANYCHNCGADMRGEEE